MKIAIIGGGVVGRITSLKLIASGYDLTLFEQHSFDFPRGAAVNSAAMITPLAEASFMSPKMMNLAIESLKLWPNIIHQLDKMAGTFESVFFQNNGSLAIAFPEDQAHLGAFHTQSKNLVSHHSKNIQQLYNNELVDMEPALFRFDYGIHFKSEGQLCNRQFLKISSQVIQKAIRVIDYHHVTQPEFQHLQKEFDWVIDCRGVGASEYPMRQTHETVKSIRGEIIRVKTKDITLLHPIRIVQDYSHIYVVPKPNHEFVVGSTSLHYNKHLAITVQSSLELLGVLFSIHPGFADAEIIETSVGVRASYGNTEPQLIVHENVISVNGLGRYGWSVAPALSDQIMNLIAPNIMQLASRA